VNLFSYPVSLSFLFRTCRPLLPLLLLLHSLYAQVPQRFNYQGIARDEAGNPLSNRTLGIRLQVLPAADAAEPEFEEVQSVQTNAFGLYTLQIGGGTALRGEMKGVQWESGNKYIRVMIDPKGGEDYSEAGTTQLLSVPYALYADKAGVAKSAGGGSRAANNFIEKTNGSGVVNSTSQIYDNGTTVGIGTGSTPNGSSTLHLKRSTNGNHLYMENPVATSFGSFRLVNDIASNVASFTKYGSAYPGGYTGISALYPYANALGYGNNGPFLNAGTGNIGFAITKGGTNKLKLHIDALSERVGIGGNSAPAARVHINNTDTGNDTLKFTNTTTGHTVSDGFEIRTNGNTARLMNRENAALVLGTRDTDRVAVLGSGNVGIGTNSPTIRLDVNGQLRIRGGNPGAGKVLTSDSTGTASWSVPTGSGMPQGTMSGQVLYWNGSQWVLINPGPKGSVLHLCNGEPSWSPCPPDISTDSVNSITGGSANVFFRINLQSSSVVIPVDITDKGVCWSTTPNPTVQNSVLSAGPGGTPSPLPYFTTISGLNANTTYYVRSYLTYSGGTIYGNPLSFATGAPSLPQVSTAPGLIVSGGAIECGGTVANTSGAPITNRGIFYATAPGVSNINPSVGGGAGIGTFTVQIPNTVPGQTYYWKAYALNSAGLSYGQELSMTAGSIYAGTWLGTYSGSDNGTFIINVDFNGNITGSFTSTGFLSIFGPQPASGVVDAFGNFSGTTSTGSSFQGSMTVNGNSGNATGNWSNPSIGSGPLQGTR
jgi:hypothetical protein